METIEIGSPESELEYVPDEDGKPTDVIRRKDGKPFETPPNTMPEMP